VFGLVFFQVNGNNPNYRRAAIKGEPETGFEGGRRNANVLTSHEPSID